MATDGYVPPPDHVSELKRRLSSKASVYQAEHGEGTQLRARWSAFGSPDPHYVVSVATENDVAETVKYSTVNGLQFLAQNGGSGWATTFDLGTNGVLIDLAQLNHFVLGDDETQATIGGGARVKQTVNAAYDAGVAVLTGNCNCVGTLGALLGGGYGYLSGVHGMGVDNVVSLRAVLPDGQLHTIDQKSDPDLFWAFRGAGPNFGIVTSAVVRAFPLDEKHSSAWSGPVIFSSEKLEELVHVINDLDLEPRMNIFMYFVSAGPPDNTPMIVTTPFLLGGTNEEGHQKFAKLFDVGPMLDNTGVVPAYNRFNDGGDAFCTPELRRPAYSAGIQKMVPSTWRTVWDLYIEFQRQPGAENSVVLLERYPMGQAQSVANDSASFPNRHFEYNAIVVSAYTDPALDTAAQEFGTKVRDAWRETSGLITDVTYVNFAHGDEDLEVVYGESLPRLRDLKKKVDPDNVFNQWFNIK